MRFDEFTAEHDIPVVPVDQFDGFDVAVGVPPDWVALDTVVGMGIWVSGVDAGSGKFCANAVLTMNRIDAPLDAVEVFTMLCEQQLQSVPGSHGLHREVAAAPDGHGVLGLLSMCIDHELVVLDSMSLSRIIPVDQQTLIAQLTVTELHDEPMDWDHIRLSVRAAPTASPDSSATPGGSPVGRTPGGR